MKPRTRLKWDRLLCRIFDHKWNYTIPEADGWGWRACKRCAEAEARPPKPPAHPNCMCVLIPDDGITGPDPEPPSRWIN